MNQLDKIAKVVAAKSGVDPDALHQDNRKKEIVQARQMAMLFMSQMHFTDPVIASFFGKDRNTVRLSVKVMSCKAQADAGLRMIALQVCFEFGISTGDFFRYCRMVPK